MRLSDAWSDGGLPAELCVHSDRSALRNCMAKVATLQRAAFSPRRLPDPNHASLICEQIPHLGTREMP
jgi:hypothetical protein